MPDDRGSDETLPATLPATMRGDSHPDRISLPPPLPTGDTVEERYARERVLGEGGMGIVALCRDQRIGRSVAMKVLRQDHADEHAQRRFLREAQLQGQLEHPAVVPVYDLGSRNDGSVFFTMKRIRGITLHEIIRLLASGDPDAERKYSRRRLLGAFAQVCLAVEFAHSRGVLHRDLKPSNIMLGDFGEVYVLDWGIAKLDAGTEPRSKSSELAAVAVPATQTGSVLGTPGYMAPEQVRGHDVGPAADLYSLGAILFELLALEPLHAPGTLDAILSSTLGAVEARPSVRAPHREVSPELDEVCRVATAADPAARHATVRDLHDAIDRYLAGERDLELRRAKAAEHAAAARAEARAAIEASDETVIEARRRAMKHIGKALGLDPENQDAIAAMVDLLTTPPKHLPPEVAAAIELGERRRLRKIARLGSVVYLGIWLFLPLLLWVGIRDVTPVVILFGGVTIAGLVSLRMAMSRAPDPKAALIAMLASNIGFGAISGMLGPLVFVPTLAVVNTLAFTIHVARRQRMFVFAAGMATFLVPFALELVGILPPSYQFGVEGMLIVPRALALEPTATMIVLAIAQVAAVLLGALTVGVLRDYVDESERRTYIYAWHLREFVPDSYKRDTDPVGRRGWPAQ